MANGPEWTSKTVFLSVLLCVARGVYSGRHPKIEGLLSSHGKGFIVAGEETELEVLGSGLSWGLELGLTSVDGVQGGSCWSLITPPLTPNELTQARATFTLMPAHTMKIPVFSKTEVWVCTRDRPHLRGGRARHMGGWIHQGPATRLLLVPSQQRSPHRVSQRSAEQPPPLVETESALATPLPLQDNETKHSSNPTRSETSSGVKDQSGKEDNGDGDSDSVPDKPKTGESLIVSGENATRFDGAGVGDKVPSASSLVNVDDIVNLMTENPSGGRDGDGDGSGVWESITIRAQDVVTSTSTALSEDAASPNLVDMMLGDMPVDHTSARTITLGDAANKEITDKPRTTKGDEREGRLEEGIGSLGVVNLSDSFMGMMNEPFLGEESQPKEILAESPSNSGGSIPDGLFNAEGLAAASQPVTEPLGVGGKVRITGMRIEEHAKGIFYEDGSAAIQTETDAIVRFFGEGITETTEFLFTSNTGDLGSSCTVATTNAFKITDKGDFWGTAEIRLPAMTEGQDRWYLCVRDSDQGAQYHQGNDPWLTIKSYNQLLPMWLQGLFIIVLLCLSGLFSGLNLGLMALDKTELKIVSNTGSPKEKRYAKAIEPVRAHGNFLLCTLLLGNVLVNSSLTILLDELSTGLIAVIGSTIGIVIFGEIIPQALCSRHGLAVGARTVWLVRVFMVITGPASYPISKILDLVLGEEIGNTYDRERLKELIRLQVTHDHIDLKTEEQNIICGALEFHKKTVGEVMTKLDDVYMLSVDACLDFNTINEMMQQGFSRVPVYEGERTNIISMLFIKDLAFIDPDDNTPLKTLIQYYQNPLNFVFMDTTLDLMLKDFKEGSKGHMAFVQKINNEGDCDPFYEVIGLVTLEDVIEELIQEEIVDETDVFTDNRSKRRRAILGRRDFTEFSQAGNQTNHKRVQISSQLQVAAFQYLRTSVEPFKESQLSEVIVKKLLNQDVIHCIKLSNKDHLKPEQQHTYIFSQGKPVDYFVLILEGHVEVVIGKEGLTFESGPFTYFGLAALSQTQCLGESPSASTQLSKGSIKGSVQSLDSAKFTFVPDYSVRAITEVMYLKIRRSHYVAARRAFLLEQSQKEPYAENFEKEMEKMLNEDEDTISPHWDSTTPTSKETSGMPNGSAIQAFNSVNSMDFGSHIYPPSPAFNSSIKNSISVPGTPLSSHSQLSMKPSNSFTNLQEFPSTVSSINVEMTRSDNQNSTARYPLTNNLSESSIEDNGEQKVIGSPDVITNMGRHSSVDYKQSNLDNEGVLVHRRGESFS
ncbi:unextended protein-like [Palaemon carinicauda]|uniref:unextended protein-like n=1 Tax=Palaemon carinicauda TaxID=392227 RepID=UPI0035B5E0E4